MAAKEGKIEGGWKHVISRVIFFQCTSIPRSLYEASSRQCRYHVVDMYTSMVIGSESSLLATVRVFCEVFGVSTKSVLRKIVS